MNRIKTIVLVITSIILSASVSQAQDSTKNMHPGHQRHMMMGSMKHRTMHTMEMDSIKMKDTDSTNTHDSIVREGVIDLTSIDENKDGYVFQDTMDWNVISDRAGKCPLCGMTLKKVSLGKAKENLVKHNFMAK